MKHWKLYLESLDRHSSESVKNKYFVQHTIKGDTAQVTSTMSQDEEQKVGLGSTPSNGCSQPAFIEKSVPVAEESKGKKQKVLGLGGDVLQTVLDEKGETLAEESRETKQKVLGLRVESSNLSRTMLDEKGGAVAEESREKVSSPSSTAPISWVNFLKSGNALAESPSPLASGSSGRRSTGGSYSSYQAGYGDGRDRARMYGRTLTGGYASSYGGGYAAGGF